MVKARETVEYRLNVRPAAIVVYPAIYMLEFIENPGCKNDLLPDKLIDNCPFIAIMGYCL